MVVGENACGLEIRWETGVQESMRLNQFRISSLVLIHHPVHTTIILSKFLLVAHISELIGIKTLFSSATGKADLENTARAFVISTSFGEPN